MCSRNDCRAVCWLSELARAEGMSSMSSSALCVRHVLAGEHALLRKIRLASLAADPGAFGSTYARDSAQAPEWWERWAAQSEEGTTQRTFEESFGGELDRVEWRAAFESIEPHDSWPNNMAR
jgi:hypothetical protein